MKLKKNLKAKEIETSYQLLRKNLANTNDISKILDTVYAMGKRIKERLGVKRTNQT